MDELVEADDEHENEEEANGAELVEIGEESPLMIASKKKNHGALIPSQNLRERMRFGNFLF